MGEFQNHVEWKKPHFKNAFHIIPLSPSKNDKLIHGDRSEETGSPLNMYMCAVGAQGGMGLFRLEEGWGSFLGR